MVPGGAVQPSKPVGVPEKPSGQSASLSTSDAPIGAISKNSDNADVTKQLQIELRRVGCSASDIAGNWTKAAQRSLELFNRNAGTKLNVKVASLDELDVVKSKTARVCPLVCEHGYKVDPCEGSLDDPSAGQNS